MSRPERNAHLVAETIFCAEYMLNGVYFSFGKVYITAAFNIGVAHIVVAWLITDTVR